NNGNDYNVILQSASGTITPADLTIAAVSDSKVYDGTINSNQAPIVGTLFNSDSVSNLSQVFASRHVLGTNNSTLNVSVYTVYRCNNGNDYNVILQSANGTITPADLTIAAVSDSKIYDGTINSSQAPTVGTLFNSDSVSNLSQV